MLAVENENEYAADMLIQHKASVNAQDRHGKMNLFSHISWIKNYFIGETALMIAASMNNNVIINKLLEVSIRKIYNNLNYLIK